MYMYKRQKRILQIYASTIIQELNTLRIFVHF